MHQVICESEEQHQLVINEYCRPPNLQNTDDLNYNVNSHTGDYFGSDNSCKDDVKISRKRNSNKSKKVSPYEIANKKIKVEDAKIPKLKDEGYEKFLREKETALDLGIVLREPEDAFDANLIDTNDVKNKVFSQETYKKGCVVYGTKNAINSLLKDKTILTFGYHGVIIDTCKDISISAKETYTINKDFTHDALLGIGGVGSAHLLTDVKTKYSFVSKQMKKAVFARKEVDVMLQLNHKNITQFLGAAISQDEVHIFQTYSGSSLHKIVKVNKIKFTEDEIIDLSIQALSALAFMHQYGILHMDIKPDNICLNEDGTLYLTDFGSCLTHQHPLEFNGLTPEYMSPELCQLFLNQLLINKNIHPLFKATKICGKNDVYSWALTMSFLLEGDHIMLKYMGCKTNEELIQRRGCFAQQIAVNPHFMQNVVSDTITSDLKNCIQRLLSGNVEKRLTAEDGKSQLEEIQSYRNHRLQSTECVVLKRDNHDNIKKMLKEKVYGQTDLPLHVQEETTPAVNLPPEHPVPNYPNFALLD